MPTPCPDGDYAVTVMYSVPDDAWYLELDLVARQRTLVTAIVPDEDPTRGPTVCFDTHGPHVDIPYAVIRWFMDQVDEEIRTSRAWMRMRPELVEVVRGLRQEYLGAIADEEFRDVLPEVRLAVPEADLAGVLAAAFGRRPDGSTVDRPPAPVPAEDRSDGRPDSSS